MNKSIFSALWLEKMAMSITIGLIVMVAALNIIASLVLLVVVVSAILVCFVATIYPSRQAAKLDPAQALRYQ